MRNLTRIYLGGVMKFIGGLLTGDYGGGKGDTYVSGFSPPAGGKSAADQIAEQNAAAEEAARKERAELNRRSGARASLLTDPNLEQTFGSNPVGRKTLLGMGA
jgi:hypothetical protein